MYQEDIDAQFLERCLRQLSGSKKAVIKICKDEERENTLRKLRKLSLEDLTAGQSGGFDITFLIDMDIAQDVAVILESVDAEVVVMYFADDVNMIIHKLLNNHCAIDFQKNAIENGGCYLTLTWVTNENQVYIDYDSLRIKRKKILESLER